MRTAFVQGGEERSEYTFEMPEEEGIGEVRYLSVEGKKYRQI